MAGIVRKIDDLGRVSIPKEVRKTLGWYSGDEIEMSFNNDSIILRKYLPDYQARAVALKEMLILDPEVENKQEILAALDTVISNLSE